MNEYTDFEFWKNYWQNCLISPTKNVFFESILNDLPKDAKVIEIGGFPGNNVAFFIKEKGCSGTIMDFYIDPDIIRKVEQINNIPSNSINHIKKDFLKTDFSENYDVVCSFGFMEHFVDTKNIIARHLKLLKPGGQLIITIPNFKGINGWVQKKFDHENYEKHNVNCMNIAFLKEIMKSFELKSFEVSFIGSPAIWLEKSAKLNWFWTLFLKNLNRFLKRQPFKKNHFTSPHIYIKARK